MMATTGSGGPEGADDFRAELLRPGLWRWTAPHPDWSPSLDRPGGWPRAVGCLGYEAPDAIVLIDPLAPPAGTREATGFWEHLDRTVLPGGRPGRPVAVLLGNDWHDRSAQAVYDRYHARLPVSIWAHPAARGHVDCVLTDAVAEGAPLPGGVLAYGVGVPYPSEVAYYLPLHRALACADSVIGAGDGRLRVAPAGWVAKDAAVQERYRTAFRPDLRRLLDLPLDLLLPGHGPPVLQDARAALAAAIDAPAWGEDR